MIEYPMKTLVDIGITDIILITGGKKPGSFLELFTNGEDCGAARIFYTYQKGNAGIVDALRLAAPFVEPKEKCVVILGDNYFEGSLKRYFNKWMKSSYGAGVLLKKVDSPWDFGIAEIKNRKIVSIEEKPSDPKSSLAVTGCYFLDERVWDFVKLAKPSDRGEYEIADVLNQYLLNGDLSYFVYDDFWLDMGTFKNLMTAAKRVEDMESKCEM
jgi:glucose-1-phosphate thymidylyltransferase